MAIGCCGGAVGVGVAWGVGGCGQAFTRVGGLSISRSRVSHVAISHSSAVDSLRSRPRQPHQSERPRSANHGVRRCHCCDGRPARISANTAFSSNMRRIFIGSSGKPVAPFNKRSFCTSSGRTVVSGRHLRICVRVASKAWPTTMRHRTLSIERDKH